MNTFVVKYSSYIFKNVLDFGSGKETTTIILH
nr:MAG TPA: Polysaccharide biosynthesis [Crassvirales sp.]